MFHLLQATISQGTTMVPLHYHWQIRRYYWHIRRRLEPRFNVRASSTNGLSYQQMYNGKIYIRGRSDFISQEEIDSLCRNVYFREYLPGRADTVVDIGAGYGHEALYCNMHSQGVRYIGVEVQPSIYECLANTFAPYRPNLQAYPRAISDDKVLYVDSAAGKNYEDVQTTGDGAVEVATISWQDFLKRFSIGRVSLLKINIEGGERFLLPVLGSLKEIDRVIISAHDFRADRGEGEHFRTREFVMDYLRQAGFEPRSLKDEEWLRDWIYADRGRN
jgi:FkbM family methyltransferase